MNDNNIVLTTIRALLKLKGKAGYTEIAKVSGVKYLKVIQILNKNERFLEFDKDSNVTLVRNYFKAGSMAHEHSIFKWWTENEDELG